MDAADSPTSTRRLAWAALVINLLTVLGGTLVRATRSGAGCGESWPSCRGSVVPELGEIKTVIEFGHRVTSGLALIAVLALFVSIYRHFPRGSQARRAASYTAVAIVVESLLGAFLVVARLVEDDASLLRAIAMPVHLVNTLFLLAALTACLWIVTTGEPLRWLARERTKLLVAAFGMVLLGVSGAVAALADTLFPAESLRAGLAADFDRAAHIFTQLRILHPLLAVMVSAFLLHLAGSAWDRARRPAQALVVLVCLQLVVGVLNVVLLTPVVVQLVHLLIADLVWIAILLLGAELGRSGAGEAATT